MPLAVDSVLMRQHMRRAHVARYLVGDQREEVNGVDNVHGGGVYATAEQRPEIGKSGFCNGTNTPMVKRHFSSGYNPNAMTRRMMDHSSYDPVHSQITVGKRFISGNSGGSNPVARRTDLLDLENKVDKAVSTVEKGFSDFALKQGNEMSALRNDVSALRNDMNSLSKTYDAHEARTREVLNGAHLTWIKNTLWAVTFVVAMFYRYDSLSSKTGKDDDAVETVEPTSNFGE